MAYALPMNRSIIALALAFAACPAFADGPEYLAGLFENSPLVPSGPPHAAIPSEPSRAPEILPLLMARKMVERLSLVACAALARMSGMGVRRDARRRLGASWASLG